MPRWILALCFVFVSPVVGQVGKETSHWQFIKDDPKAESIVTVLCEEGVAGGFVASIDGDRVLLTAAHIVYKMDPVTRDLLDEPAANIVVCFRGGVVRSATPKAKDLENDVCWLECEIPDEIPALVVASVDAKHGDVCYIIGLGGLSLKAAPIRHWSAPATSATGDEVILDCSLIPGDSGGAILNEAGEVVSIVSGGFTWQPDRAFVAEDGRPISVTWPCRGPACKFIRQVLGKE